MEWQAVAKSAIGTKHLKVEKPCQDSCAYSLEEKGQVIVGAVSDGMGSAEYSNIGSKLAVDKAIAILKANKAVWTLEADKSKLKHVFENLLQRVREDLASQAQANHYSIDELACTLLAFVATPKWLAAMQIGDGLIVVRPKDQEEYQLLFKPDKGEFTNITTSVTSAEAKQEMLFDVWNFSAYFICAATDGIERISLEIQNWSPFDKFFLGLEKAMLSSETDLSSKGEEIEDFLNGEKINSETDDKTLLLYTYSTLINDDTRPVSPESSEASKSTDLRSGGNVRLSDTRPHISSLKRGNKTQSGSPRLLRKGGKTETTLNSSSRLHTSFFISFFINIVLSIHTLSLWTQSISSTPLNPPPFVSVYYANSRNPAAYLIEPSKSPLFEVWVFTPLRLLDTASNKLDIPQGEKLNLYSSELQPVQITFSNQPIGYLAAGSYAYSTGTLVKDHSDFRWVKVQLQIQQ